MPDYSLQVNLADNYNPSHFTALREISKNMTDQYNNAMVAYGELSAKANMLEQLANDVQGTDSVAYQNYKNYADNLRRHTDLLASRGLNPSLSKNLMMASSDYSRIISPIEKAMEARTKEAERIATLRDKYPSLIAERDAGEIGIDQWMKLGNNYHAKTLDLETVANRARERFEALKSQIMEFVSENGGLDAVMTKHPEAVKKWFKVNVPWLYESMYKTGSNPEDVRKLLAGDPSMDDSLLKGIYNDTLRMYGTNTWNTDYDHYSKEQNALRRLNLDNTMRGTIGGESPNAIGKTEFEKYEDRINSQILMERERLAEQRRQFEAQMKAKGYDANGNALNPPPESKMTTEAVDIVADGDQVVDADKARDYILKVIGASDPNSNLTENQIEEALKEKGYTDKNIQELISSGQLNNSDFINSIKETAKSKPPVGVGTIVKSGFKMLGSAILSLIPQANVLTGIYDLVKGNKRGTNDPWKWTSDNAKILYYGSLAKTATDEDGNWITGNPENSEGVKMKNIYNKEGIDAAYEAYEKFYNNSLTGYGFRHSGWGKLSKEELQQNLDGFNKVQEKATENLVKLGVFKSTKTAQSELQNYVDQYKDTGLTPDYLINLKVASGLWNRPQMQSQMGGAFAKSVSDGVKQIVLSNVQDGKANVYKINDKGVPSNDKETWTDIAPLINDEIILKTMSVDEKKSGLLNFRIKLKDGNEYTIPVSDWNRDKINVIKQGLSIADSYEKLAEPSNIRGRQKLTRDQKQSILTGFTDQDIKKMEYALLQQRVISQKDIEDHTDNWKDAILSKACYSKSLAHKEASLIRSMQSSINNSNRAKSMVEDEELKNPITVTSTQWLLN